MNTREIFCSEKLTYHYLIIKRMQMQARRNILCIKARGAYQLSVIPLVQNLRATRISTPVDLTNENYKYNVLPSATIHIQIPTLIFSPLSPIYSFSTYFPIHKSNTPSFKSQWPPF